MGSLVLSVALSILAVGLLNYFFTEPLFTFRVDYPQDIAGLIAFLVTSLIVTSLVSRSRKLADLAIASQKETLALKDQLRLIIDTTPALVWSALPDGSNDFVNRGWVEFTGLSLEDTKGSGWSAAIHPDDLPAHWDRWRMSVATGKPFEDRVRFRRADGQHRWLLVRAAPLRDERGNIVRWYGTCTDIDESIAAGERAKLAERELQLVIDTIPELVWSALPDGSNDFVNRGWTEYTGLSVHDTKDSGWSAAIHPDDLAVYADRRQMSIATGEPFGIETRIRSWDGQYRWFLVRASPLRDEQNNIVKWYGTCTDIDASKAAGERVREAERELQVAIDTIPALVWITLPDGSCSFNNRRWLEYTGLTSEEALGWGYEKAIHPDDFARSRAEWAARLQAGEPFEDESRLRRADGEYRLFLNRAVPLRDVSGHVVKWYGTGTDIEDRKRAERLQAELSRMIRVTTMSEVTGSITHEVIQPLSAIVTNGNTCLHWLADTSTDLAKARSAAARVVRDAERACNIVERIRALMTKSEIQKAELSINDIIRDVLALARNELAHREVSLHTELSSDLPEIFGDRVQLQQLVLNLLTNSLESMATVTDRPKALTIETRQDVDDQVHVVLCDSGVGLNSEHIDQLFNAFFTTKIGGTGMGLAICRSIVEAHGGRIWASPGTPHGAVFQFSLPTTLGP